jgi:hypothetical protein
MYGSFEFCMLGEMEVKKESTLGFEISEDDRAHTLLRSIHLVVFHT